MDTSETTLAVTPPHHIK